MLVGVNYHTFFSCLCTELCSYFKIDTVPIQLNQCPKTPTTKIRKDQVLQEQICDIIPPVHETNVLVWWESLEDCSMVELRSSPKLHRGKSNNSKEYLIQRFLFFIDT
jgi:hypothetical protein